MNLKRIFLITGVISILAACVFFTPHTIRQFAGKKDYDRALVVIEKSELPYSTPAIERETYEIKSEKGIDVLDSLFGIFQYHNAFNTIFSDTLETDSGLINISLYQGENVVHTIQISDRGLVLLDGRLYGLKAMDAESSFMNLLGNVLSDHGETITQ